LRWCTAQRMRNVTKDSRSWPRSGIGSCAMGTVRSGYRPPVFTWPGTGLGRESAMTPYPSSGLRLTNCSVRAGRWDGVFPATGVLVETLLERGADGDVREAEAAIERLATAPTDDDLPVREIVLLRLRALVAQARTTGHQCTRQRGRHSSVSARLSVVRALALPTSSGPSVPVRCVAPGIGVRGRRDSYASQPQPRAHHDEHHGQPCRPFHTIHSTDFARRNHSGGRVSPAAQPAPPGHLPERHLRFTMRQAVHPAPPCPCVA
jgi:hypothetical protein